MPARVNICTYPARVCLAAAGMKVAVLQGDRLRTEEVRLPENLVDGAGPSLDTGTGQAAA